MTTIGPAKELPRIEIIPEREPVPIPAEPERVPYQDPDREETPAPEREPAER